MNMIIEKGEVPGDFSKYLIKPLYNKGDKGECGYCRGIILTSIGSIDISFDATGTAYFLTRGNVERHKLVLEHQDHFKTIFQTSFRLWK